MRVDDDQQQTQAPPGAPASDEHSVPEQRPAEQAAADDLNAEQATQRAHPGWGPPEYYTPDGDRRDEPPGPVATDEPNPPHASTDAAPAPADAVPADGVPAPTPADGVPAEDVPDVEDVDGGDFPPEDATGGTTYGEPVPPDEVTAGEPVVGVAQVPDGAPADADVDAFWDKPTVDGYRDRWQQIQLRFIDDPRQAAERAQSLVSDVLDGFTAAVSRQRDELNRWQSAETDDTEELRTTVRRYRDLLDRLLAL